MLNYEVNAARCSEPKRSHSYATNGEWLTIPYDTGEYTGPNWYVYFLTLGENELFLCNRY